MAIKKEKNRSLIIIIGFLFLFLGIDIIIFYIGFNNHIINQEKNAIDEYYINLKEEIINNESANIPEKEEVKEHKRIEYIAVLKIPKISLERGLVDPNSYLNNINNNIQILNNSSMPDEINGNVILASHSGNARISYFKNINKLEFDDDVIIDYKNKTYTYKVINIYEIEKTGKAQIIRNKNTSTLTLVTCKHNTNKQIIVICELQSTN